MPSRGRPRAQSTATATVLAPRTLLLDNGGYSIKAGIVGDGCRLIANCVGRSRDRAVLVGSQLEQCRDFGEMVFRRPVEKGFVVNWEAERAVWQHSFVGAAAVLPLEPRESNLVLTEAPNCPAQLQTNCDQMVFEEWEFASYCRVLGG